MQNVSHGPTIVVVDNSRAVTGALNAIRHATEPLRDKFRFVYVLPTGSTARSVLVDDGFPVYELPFVEISRRKKDLLQYLPMLFINGWRLYKLAKKEGAVIVHLNDFYNLTGFVARAFSLGRLQVFTHVRFLPQTLPQPFARTWRWMAEHAAQQVLCVSEAVRKYFAPAHARVRTVYDPLPPRGEALPAYQVLAKKNEPINLLYLSNYIRGKGQNFALEAFIHAYGRNSNLRLHFVGGDMGMAKNQEFRQELEATAEAAGVAGAVRFDGFASDTESIMKAHDIVLNFSEAESFSLTCLDALYYGVPLIASDCGGPAELFESGESGLLVANRSVASMTEAILSLAADEELRRNFSIASRSFVRQKFAPSHTYLALASCYKAVITARGL